MKLNVIHDEHGNIIAISSVIDLKAAGSQFDKVVMVPGPGQQLLIVETSKEHEKKTLRELHDNYSVDLSTSKLALKSL